MPMGPIIPNSGCGLRMRRCPASHSATGACRSSTWRPASSRRLVLGRDRLGKKPLVYRHDAGRLLFASELKSLLTVPGLPREIDPSAIDEYLTYQYVPHPNTIFRGFRKLPPGCYAVYQDDKLDVRPYWRPDFTQERRITKRAAIAELSEVLDSAVKMRMRSDVPLGAFLSGG